MQQLRLKCVLAAAVALVSGSYASAQSCVVDREKELLIRDLSVVEDCCRTNAACPALCAADQRGVWTFKHMIEGLAGTTDPVVLHKFVINWLDEWMADQSVNGFTAPSRTQIDSFLIQPWLAASGGSLLDMNLAPFRLLAIVNRLDLRKVPSGYATGNAGEARFVFGVTRIDDPISAPSFTVIFEYGIQAATCTDVKNWAADWHALGSMKFGPKFNVALQKITSRFTDIGRNKSKPNGSAINQVRSNEVELNLPWELREFRLTPSIGQTAVSPLEQVTVKETPDRNTINGTRLLASFINTNEAAILNGTIVVPDTFQGQNFLGGSSFNDIDFWSAPRINNNQARHLFSLNTCNACHGAETNTGFLQVFPRSPGDRAGIAGFLGGEDGLGIDVTDPVDLVTERHFNDLARRAKDLCSVIQDPCSKLEADTPLNRVH